MKKQILISIVFILTILLGSGCKKTNVPPTKSAIINMSAVPTKQSASLGQIPVSDGQLEVFVAKVNIANLQIEENSGNDVEQSGNNNDGGNDKSGIFEGGESGDSGNETDNDDILLAGPYSLDISSGTANIDQVSIYPGTFKKVDFNLQVNNDTVFNGNSIIISGNYTKTDGTVIPFTIKSGFSQMVQLPLANNGITVAANSSVNISIVFDIQSWLLNLNFSGAQLSGNEIIIDTSNNVTIFNDFNSRLMNYVESEVE